MSIGDQRRATAGRRVHSPAKKVTPGGRLSRQMADKPPAKKAAGSAKHAAAGRAARAVELKIESAAPWFGPPDDPISAIELLGVEPGENGKSLTSREWVEVIRNGVQSKAVDTLTKFLVISKGELSDAIDISPRTLSRRKAAELLPRDETAKLVRVARVIERAEEVFEDSDAARIWLKSPNTALSGETPMSLLDTEIGAESVMDVLGRIEYGVFA